MNKCLKLAAFCNDFARDVVSFCVYLVEDFEKCFGGLSVWLLGVSRGFPLLHPTPYSRERGRRGCFYFLLIVSSSFLLDTA